MADMDRLGPAVLVIFGAGGDLTWRKLVPALYNLFIQNRLPVLFEIIGMDMKPMTDEAFREHLHQGIETFSVAERLDTGSWYPFSKHLSYTTADFKDPQSFTTLSERIAGYERVWKTQASHIYYQATPPSMVELILEQLNKAHLNRDHDRARIVLEKPFGHDLASAKELNRMLRKYCKEFKYTGSTTTWAKRPSRTSWRSGFQTRCLNRSGIGDILITSRLPSLRALGSSTGGATMSTPAPCEIWSKTTSFRSCA